jgi:hypothetical protein
VAISLQGVLIDPRSVVVNTSSMSDTCLSWIEENVEIEP